MGAEVAVRSGAGTIVLDIRRGDGPKACFNYTMASIATTHRLIKREPEIAATIRAIVKTQAALRADPGFACDCGRTEKFSTRRGRTHRRTRRARYAAFTTRRFPREFVSGINQFSRDAGHPAQATRVMTRSLPHSFSHLWTNSSLIPASGGFDNRSGHLTIIFAGYEARRRPEEFLKTLDRVFVGIFRQNPPFSLRKRKRSAAKILNFCRISLTRYISIPRILATL